MQRTSAWLVAMTVAAACGGTATHPSTTPGPGPSAGATPAAHGVPGDAEGWYAYSTGEVVAAPLPARFTAPLPTTPMAFIEQLGDDAVLTGYVQRLLKRWDGGVLDRLRTAVESVAVSERAEVVERYAHLVDDALGFGRATCEHLRPLMRSDEPLAPVMYLAFLNCALEEDLPLLEALPVPPALRAELRERAQIAPRYSDDEATELATRVRNHPDDAETLTTIYTTMSRLAATGDARAADLLVDLNPPFDAALAGFLSDADALRETRQRVYQDIVDGMPPGPSQERLRARCAGKAGKAVPLCADDVLAHLGENAVDPETLAERHQMWAERQKTILVDLPAQLDDAEATSCDGPPSGPFACRRWDEQARALRSVGLLGEHDAPTAPRAATAGASIAAFDLLVTAHHAATVGLYDDAENIDALQPLVASELPDVVLASTETRHEQLGSDDWESTTTLHLFAGGLHATSESSLASDGAKWLAAVGLLNSTLRARGSDWRVLILDGSRGELRVVAAPARALAAGIAHDLLRPDRGEYHRAR